MTPIPDDIVRAAIDILGRSGIEEDQIEHDVRALVTDDMTARRLIDWIPEAFGVVLVSHISNKIILPDTFSAKSAAGKWSEFPFESEPVFASSLRLAQTIFHEGPRELFQNISNRSAMTNTVNNALNAGTSLDGGCLSGPALIGIPAEVYPTPPPKSFWRRLLGR